MQMLQYCGIEFVWNCSSGDSWPQGPKWRRSCPTTVPCRYGSSMVELSRTDQGLTKMGKTWSPVLKMSTYTTTAVSVLTKNEGLPWFSVSDVHCSELCRAQLQWHQESALPQRSTKGLHLERNTFLQDCQEGVSVTKKETSSIKLFLKITLEGVKSKSLFIFKVFQIQFPLSRCSFCFLFIYFRPDF